MPRKTIIPLYDGDDFETLSELRLAVTIAERAAAERRRIASPLFIGDEKPAENEIDPAVRDARAAYDAFLDEAAERAEEWELHAISNEQFRGLLEAHPPRQVPVEGENDKTQTHEDDEAAGVDTTTFGKALLLFREADEDGDEFRTVVRPELDEVALRKRVKSLSEGEFRDMWQAAYLLNSGGINDPKASRFGTRSSSET